MSELDFQFVDDGEKDQLPVVFLHAFPYHSAMWSGQRAALRERARFVAFDARGLGLSQARSAAYMLEHSVDDLFALLDHLAIGSAVLCGLSMGGYVALRAMERAPERFRGLVLADTQAGADSNEAKVSRAAGLRALWQSEVSVYADQQLKKQLSPHTHSHNPELVTRLQHMIADSGKEGIAASLVAIATRTDLTGALSGIRVPTRIIVGEDDIVTPPAAAKAMAEQIPGADVHVLARSGHLSNMEAEVLFNRLLLEHLERVR